jgi:hypothetical protein
MDILVKATENAQNWSLIDLLGRSMGAVTEQDGRFAIVPHGHALETMQGMHLGPFASLDAALAEIEKHTRGTCRREPFI